MKPPRTGLEAFLWRVVAGRPSKRDVLASPFLLDGKITATNGHIVVQWPTEEIPVGKEAPDESVLSIFRDRFAAPVAEDRYMDIPPLPDFLPCNTCCGDGLDLVGWEDTTCADCDGYGEHRHRIMIGDSGYCIRYLRLLSSLPGIKFAPGDNDNPAAFKFDSGRGLLMPLRR